MTAPGPRKTLQVAIDGTAASGKSTVAMLVAHRLRISYLDTGKLYRAVTLHFLDHDARTPETWDEDWACNALKGAVLEIEPSHNGECRICLGKQDVTEILGSTRVEIATSYAARLPAVRDWLLERQREIARTHSVVMAGRDIGTIVLPQATVKVFMEADLEERAKRRLTQQSGENFTEEELQRAVDALAARDRLDAERDCAPMVAADDALRLNSTRQSPEQLVDLILTKVPADFLG